MASVAALAFCSAAAPCHVRGMGGSGAWVSSYWTAAFPTSRRGTLFPTGECVNVNPEDHACRSRRRSSTLSLSRAGPWSPPTSELRISDCQLRTRSSYRQLPPPLSWRGPLATLQTLLRGRAERLPTSSATLPTPPPPSPPAAATTAAERTVAREEKAAGVEAVRHSGLVLLPMLQKPIESLSMSSQAAETVATVGRSMSRGVRKPALSFIQRLVRSEAILAGVVLLAAPLILRSWARKEAEHHDTLECRNVLQTYLVAASGWACAVLATVAGKPISAVVLQVAWRAAAARSLWTWSDLGRNLTKTPGWLHASVAWWRGAATFLTIAGAAARLLVLVIAATGTWTATVAAGALSAPTLDFLPAALVTVASTPDENFGLSAAQLVLGVGLYAWVSYYACFFLPYRVLHEEYQSYERRTAQLVKDMVNGQEQNVVLSTRLGPPFSKHLLRRMARMPPGDDRDALEAAGIVRQRAGSHTVVKAAQNVKNKEGKFGLKMLALKFGDLRFWGSDLFERLEQQERRDKKTGWKPPDAPGSGPNRHNRQTYSKIMREIKVELGKTDAEMATDPSLSMSNLMTFDPAAEEGDPPDLIKQEGRPGNIDAAGENLRMKSGHEMVVVTDSTPADRAKAAGVQSVIDASNAVSYFETGSSPGSGEAFGDVNGRQQVVRGTDEVLYKSGDTAGIALENSIRSRASSLGEGSADKMTPATATRGRNDVQHQRQPLGSETVLGADLRVDGSEQQVARSTGAISDTCFDIASIAMEYSLRSSSSARKDVGDTLTRPIPTARDLSKLSHMQSFVLAHELFLAYSVIVSDCFPTL